MKRFGGAMAMVCAGLVLGASSAAAAPADLDRSFMGRGSFSASLEMPGHFGERALDMAIGPNGEFVVLSQGVTTACPAFVGCDIDLAITRYGRNGARDMSFGGTGTILAHGSRSGFTEKTAAIAIARDGKIVLAATDEADIKVARFNPDGSPDLSFGTAGSFAKDFGGQDTVADAIVDAVGNVFVLGTRTTAEEGIRPLIAKLRPNGSLDGGYGDAGVVLMGFARSNRPAGFTSLPGARLAVGLSGCCYGSLAAMARFLPNGNLDRGFAYRGWRALEGLASASVLGLAGAGGRRTIVFGHLEGRSFATRLLAGGGLDRSFGGKGIARPKNAWGGSSAVGVVDGSRRILLTTSGRTESRPKLIRLQSNGRPDRTFIAGQEVFLSSGVDRVVAIGLQSRDRIVVLAEGGECDRSCPTRHLTLLRFVGGRSAASCRGRKADVVGTRNGETIKGTPEVDVIQALGGDDKIYGRGGSDLICGGGGDDSLSGGPGRNRFLGGPGGDQIHQ